MHLADLNWLAVVVSAAAFYALGAVWYSFLFGKVSGHGTSHGSAQVCAIGPRG